MSHLQPSVHARARGAAQQNLSAPSHPRRRDPLQSRLLAYANRGETEIAARQPRSAVNTCGMERRAPRTRDLCSAPGGGETAYAAVADHTHREALPPAGL